MKPLYPDLLPSLSTDEYDKLKIDIATRGVQVAIQIDAETGDILDGWNRYSICQELGIADFPIESKTFVNEAEKKWHAVSLNINRRQLNKSQIAAYGLMYYGPVEEAEAKERQIASGGDHSKSVVPTSAQPVLDTGRVVEIVAHKVGTGKSTVAAAKKVMKESPEMFDRILKGEITAEKAAYGRPKRGKKAQRKKPINLDMECVKKLLVHIRRRRKENNDVKRGWQPEASSKMKMVVLLDEIERELQNLINGTVENSVAMAG